MSQGKTLCTYGNNCFQKNCSKAHMKKFCQASNCKDEDCDLRHGKCKNYADCSIFVCQMVHDAARKCCKNGKDCRVTDCKFVHPKRKIKNCVDGEDCLLYECNKAHPITRKGPCTHRNQCFKSTCPFLHEVGVCKQTQCNCGMRHFTKCREYETCEDADCTFGHHARRKICRNKDDCKKYHCKKVHSKSNRKGQCRNGPRCHSATCMYLHEHSICKTRNCDETCGLRHIKPCLSFNNCRNASCSYGHDDSRQICDDISDCANYFCTKAHEVSRRGPCNDGICCKRANCKFLHPSKNSHANGSKTPVRK